MVQSAPLWSPRCDGETVVGIAAAPRAVCSLPRCDGGGLGRGPGRNDERERQVWNRASGFIAPD